MKWRGNSDDAEMFANIEFVASLASSQRTDVQSDVLTLAQEQLHIQHRPIVLPPSAAPSSSPHPNPVFRGKAA